MSFVVHDNLQIIGICQSIGLDCERVKHAKNGLCGGKGNRAGDKNVAVSRELNGMDNLLLQLFVMPANSENIHVLIIKFINQPAFWLSLRAQKSVKLFTRQ